MGGKSSKEEVIIAQTASGDARASQSMTQRDTLLMACFGFFVLVAVWWLIKKWREDLHRTIRREINMHDLRKSREEV